MTEDFKNVFDTIFGPSDEESLPHPERQSVWPTFSFFNDQIDGRFPVCRVESWRQFIDNLNSEINDPTGAEIIYRGHRRYDWQLDSTLSRHFDGGAIPIESSDGLMRKFRLAMRGRGIDISAVDHENDAWAYGQHYGLATPLLDWTESPLVALFFAFQDEDPFEESKNKNATRCVFRLNRSLIEQLNPDLFYEPSMGENGRLVNQAGLFTVTPEGKDNLVSTILNELADSGAINVDNPNEVAKYICKIHIPNSARIECLDLLRKMNIHHASLFPDASGASNYCNDWLDRHVRQLKAAKAKAEQDARREKIVNLKPKIDVKGLDDETAAIAEILLLGLPSDTTIGRESLTDWAEKIESRYREVASIDWPQTPSGVAGMNVALKRLLVMFEYPKLSRSKTLELLINHYKSSYRESKSR